MESFQVHITDCKVLCMPMLRNHPSSSYLLSHLIACASSYPSNIPNQQIHDFHYSSITSFILDRSSLIFDQTHIQSYSRFRIPLQHVRSLYDYLLLYCCLYCFMHVFSMYLGLGLGFHLVYIVGTSVEQYSASISSFLLYSLLNTLYSHSYFVTLK